MGDEQTMISTFTSFQIHPVTPDFWETSLGALCVPPTETYRTKIDDPLLNNKSNYVVVYRTEKEIISLFYELVNCGIRMYVPALIKTQEVVRETESNIYVQMVEFVIRQLEAKSNLFFVFCPTTTLRDLAKITFPFQWQKQASGSGSSYISPTNVRDSITWKSYHSDPFVERVDFYDNDQIVRIIQVSNAAQQQIVVWKEYENYALELVKRSSENNQSRADSRLADQIRAILQTKAPEGESNVKKIRSIEGRFNRAFIDIQKYAFSKDSLDFEFYGSEVHFMAYTKVGSYLDLVITFSYRPKWDASRNVNRLVLHIGYTVRMMQGMIARLEDKTAYEKELPNLSNVFKSVLKFNKAEFGVDRLDIQHLTEGSTRMLTRYLSKRGEDVGLANLKPTYDTEEYATDYFRMDLRICSGVGCVNLGTHAIATDVQQINAFCGRKCATNFFRKNKSK